MFGVGWDDLHRPRCTHLTADRDERITNAYINNARVVVENAFGRLKSRFRSLRRLDCTPRHEPRWILA